MTPWRGSVSGPRGMSVRRAFVTRPSGTRTTGPKPTTAATRHGCNGCVTPTERGSPSRSGVVDDMGQRRRRVANRTVQERGRRSPITFRTDPLRSLADVEARTNYVDWLDNQRLHSLLDTPHPRSSNRPTTLNRPAHRPVPPTRRRREIRAVHSGMGETIDVDATGSSTDTAGRATHSAGLWWSGLDR